MRRLAPLLLALAACGPSTLQLPATPPAELRADATVRPITTLLDLDSVRDVTAGGERVYVATDAGLLVYGDGGAPTRLGTDAGLPSADVRAVAADARGRVWVVTAGGWAFVEGTTVSGPAPAAPLGATTALAVVDDGTVWACGHEGVARFGGEDWEGFGEVAQCTGLWPTPEGKLWVGTTRGLWHVDADDVIREHAEGRGIPAGWVRSVVPTRPGQAFVLLQDANRSHLGWFDGLRWYDYTIPEFEPAIVGLGREGGDIVLLSERYAFRIQDAATGSGVALRPIARSERDRVLGYRARVSTGIREPASEPRPPRAPSPLAPVPPNTPRVDAPGWVVSPLGKIADRAYAVKVVGGRTFVADRQRGVAVLGPEGEAARLSARTLVSDRDLQIASDERGRTWTLDGLGRVAVWDGGAFEVVALPEGTVAHAIAAARRGLYLATTIPGQPNLARVYRRGSEGWAAVAERTLSFPEGQGPLVATPMLGVTDEEELWLALRVADASRESGSRLRGVAVFRGEGEDVVYHHAASEPEVDGEGALRMPDDFGNIDLNDPGMAWFSTLVGAVRLGNSQAVVFGEARGVRGEVVSDVLVGSRGRLWVAAAEGPGYRQQQRFEFRMPQAVREARPTALALGPQGEVWAAGPNGLLVYEDDAWTIFGEERGLPTEQLVDVEVDAGGRIWLLARDRVLMLGRAERRATPE